MRTGSQRIKFKNLVIVRSLRNFTTSAAKCNINDIYCPEKVITVWTALKVDMQKSCTGLTSIKSCQTCINLIIPVKKFVKIVSFYFNITILFVSVNPSVSIL